MIEWFRALVARIRGAFSPGRIDHEFQQELDSHISLLTDKNISRGMSLEEAHRQAHIRLGGATRLRETNRDLWSFPTLDSFRQDVRYAVRTLRKSPGFAAFAILTLALSIGANTSIFTLLNAVLLQSLPVRNPEQLVVPRWSAHAKPQNIGTSSFGDCIYKDRDGPGTDSGGCSFSYPMFKEIRAEQDFFSSVGAFAGPAQLDLSGNGQATMASGELVSGDYFQTLGVRAVLGRTLEPSDELPGAEPVVVLRYGYWQSAFGGAPGTIGRTIRLNGVALTVVGVMEPSFTRLTPGKSLDLWLPLTQLVPLGLHWGGRSLDASSWWLTLVGRLKQGRPVAQAEAAVSLLFRNQTLHGERHVLKDSDDPKVTLVPAQRGLAGIRADLGQPLRLLMAAVGMVLLIACANVAGLMMARGASRQKEIAVRLALGAGRGRLIQQLLTESVILSVLGAALGILLAYWGAGALTVFVSANSYSRLEIDLHPDAGVLVFPIAIALLTGIAFGLVPAFGGTRIKVASALKQNFESSYTGRHAGGRYFGAGGPLVVAQVALSLVVLMAAGLFLRTLGKLKSIDPGFDTRNVLLFSIDPTLAGYKDDNIQNVYDEVERRIAASPGVLSVSYSNDALLNGGIWSGSVQIEGQSETVDTQLLAAGPDFFETLRIPLLKGRTFRASDERSTRLVAIVNQAFVREFLESRDPLGLHLKQDDQEREIIGVVADTKYDDTRKQNAPTAYVLLKNGWVMFAVRTAASPNALIPMVYRVVSEVDNNLPVFSVRTQEQVIDRLLFNQRLVARVCSLFALFVLVLTCIGLYGLLSYEVARRTREIGIRMALGAQPGGVLRGVITRGVAVSIIGAALGTIASFGLTRFLGSMLYDVKPSDPLTFLSVIMILLLVVLAACYIPARRAMRVDPMVALRHE
jgi:predicted permease